MHAQQIAGAVCRPKKPDGPSANTGAGSDLVVALGDPAQKRYVVFKGAFQDTIAQMIVDSS